MTNDLDRRMANESFLRRAAKIDMPFMLKGSFASRQYFHSPEFRIPNDLDWVYLDLVDAVEDARESFTNWMNAITAMDCGDGVVFKQFNAAAYGQMFEYAMSDDFPTVRTWLRGTYQGRDLKLDLDLSFNLELPLGPVRMLYQPLYGDAFWLDKTVPLALQIAWKLHQCLVRPRFKDFFDLRHLLHHSSFDATSREITIKTLLRECAVGKTPLRKLQYLLTEQEHRLFHTEPVSTHWPSWRDGFPHYFMITATENLPESWHGFLAEFRCALQHAGLDDSVLNGIEIVHDWQDVRFSAPISKVPPSSMISRILRALGIYSSY